ncbi:MAG TPA: response regulator transcription factor [Ktedonobacterales bacterium]
MKILVACSHMLVGESLTLILSTIQRDEPIECEVTRSENAVERTLSWQPDLVVVEAITDFANGIATTQQLRSMLPEVRLVMLGTDDDEATIYEAISAGADGYLTRDTSTEVLIQTLSGVLRGEVGLTRVAALRVIRQLRRIVTVQAATKPVEVDAKLTPRESEVFELVRKGMRSREIATTLCIAEGTVYKHIHNILEKLNVHSRNQALVVTLQSNRTEPPSMSDQV